MYHKNNTENSENQEIENSNILLDITKSGQVRPWKEKKMGSQKLADSYERLGNTKKAQRVRFCGSNLVYKIAPETGEKKLYFADFCKVRLCPMCAWRRSLKIFSQVSRIMDVLCKAKKYNFIFLTLTVRNCTGEELSSEIDKLFYGFKKLMLKSPVKKAVKGWFRALEITHNTNKDSSSYDTYHPHFHMILQVNPSYFKTTDYLKYEDWQKMWRDVMGLDYDPEVYVEKAKAKNLSGAVAELAKYTVKDKDYIIENDIEFTDESVRILDAALHSRRLCAFGGMMKKVHQDLKLDDAENGDLIHAEDEKIERDDLAMILVKYHWHVGIKNYVLEEM